MTKRVGPAIVAFVIVLGASGIARAQGGPNAACPAGTPAAPRPGLDWVPTQDCGGWVPAGHPLAFTAAPGAPPKTCTVQTLHGSFVFSATGFNIVAGVQQPKAIVEVIEFNGDGTLSVPAATVSVNGMIVRSSPSIGTYTVEDDCVGTVAFNGPTYDIFISKDGDLLSMIQTNPNTVFQGAATRTSR